MPAVRGSAIPRLGVDAGGRVRLLPVLALIGAFAVCGYGGTSWWASSHGRDTHEPPRAFQPATSRYIVQAGDSLWNIAQTNRLTLGGLLAVGDNARRFADVNTIYPGQAVELPAKDGGK